jgi:hypothetical protein
VLIVPRLIALIADLFIPYAWIPAFYNYSSLLISCAVVASVFSPRFKAENKPVLALAIVLVPHYTGEIFLTITNLQWILAIAMVVILLKEKPDQKYGNIVLQYAADFITVLLCGLTGPLVIFMLPFFAIRWLRSRDSYNHFLFITVAAVALIQFHFIVSKMAPSSEFVFDLYRYSPVAGWKIFGNLFFGHYVPYTQNHYFLSILYVLTLLAILFSGRKLGMRIFFLVGIHLLLLLAVLYAYKFNPEELIRAGSNPRYFYIPYVMLTWALIMLASQKERWSVILSALGLFLILISALTSDFREDPFIDYQWNAYSQWIGKQDITIPINPPGWKINVEAQP